MMIDKFLNSNNTKKYRQRMFPWQPQKREETIFHESVILGEGTFTLDRFFGRKKVVENATLELFRNPYLDEKGAKIFILEVGFSPDHVHNSVISVWLPKDCPSGHID